MAAGGRDGLFFLRLVLGEAQNTRLPGDGVVGSRSRGAWGILHKSASAVSVDGWKWVNTHVSGNRLHPWGADRHLPALMLGATESGTFFWKRIWQHVIRAHPFNLQFLFSRILAQERTLSSRGSLLHKRIYHRVMCTSKCWKGSQCSVTAWLNTYTTAQLLREAFCGCF